MRGFVLVIVVLVAAAAIGLFWVWLPAGASPAQAGPANLPTVTPPPTFTPVADLSSLSARGYCNDDDKPVFLITNDGGDMLLARRFWFLNVAGGAAVCGMIPEGPLGGGTFKLPAGASVEVIFPYLGVGGPYTICAPQRAGFPGPAYASATIPKGAACVTAEDLTPEPGGQAHVFMPALRR